MQVSMAVALLVAAVLTMGPSAALCREMLSASAPSSDVSLSSFPSSILPTYNAAAPWSQVPGNGSPPAPFINSVGGATSATPNGNLSVFTDDPGFISLPGTGIAQAILTLGPCAVDIPHNHPRAAETSFMLSGTIQFGIVQEDAKNDTLLFSNITQNQSIHIPQAIMHFAQNPNCDTAYFLASFDNTDPGVQTVWSSFSQIPTHIISGATGFPEQLVNSLKAYPLVTQPSTGGEECLKRCGLDFKTENKLTPIPASQLVP